mmetsp:Transcript_21691/g.18696  ORF Transcript_21691/g.18696 Transcript_21691/m.18696 type:complete len:125 (+) Transcript_21691:223-597(+)
MFADKENPIVEAKTRPDCYQFKFAAYKKPEQVWQIRFSHKNDTFEDLKKRICSDDSWLPLIKFWLKDSQITDLKKPLKEYDLEPVNLIQSAVVFGQIFVKTLTGKTITINIANHEEIDSVKLKV